ncbi:MAG: flagellar hook basal-body protein [Desulfobacterales bacterium]|nr:flagellar hook basal-body protein [Desulfobacterales bacterium]
MSSGMYSAVSGAATRLRMMDTISDNLSNGKTPGFKKGGFFFASMLDRSVDLRQARGIDYTQIKEGFSDFTQGELIRTGVPLQLAIEGEGFFKVRDGNGQIFFTRQGMLRRDPSGHLLTQHGMKLIGENGRPLSFPDNGVTIDEQGMAQLSGGQKMRVPVYSVPDLAMLERVGGGLFRAARPEDAVMLERPRVFQGYIEDSNVNIMREMGRMMESLRIFEACQKMMKNYRELDRKVIELGVIG